MVYVLGPKDGGTEDPLLGNAKCFADILRNRRRGSGSKTQDAFDVLLLRETGNF
jgi:hypothetical protein